MRKTTYFCASILAALITLCPGISAANDSQGINGGEHKSPPDNRPPDNRPPDNRPPNCPGNSCKPTPPPTTPPTPTPTPQVNATATATAQGTVTGTLNQNASQNLNASNSATQNATQTQGDLKQQLSGSVNIGPTSGGTANGGVATTNGGSAQTSSGQASTTSGPAHTMSGPATTVGGHTTTIGGSTSTTSGPAKTVSGAITQNVGANAEGNSLKTGDNTLSDVGNAKVQSDIAVQGSTQEQKAVATNQGVTGNSVQIDNRPVRQTPMAYAPPIYQQGGCPGTSSSGGLSFPGGALTGGKATIDSECQINAAETTVLQWNQQVAYGARLAARFAVRMRCKSELLGFSKEECAELEKDVMAKFDRDEANTGKLAQVSAERARLEAELAKAKSDARVSPDGLTQKDLEASEQRLLDALQKARLSTKLSVEIPEREFVPCPEKGCEAPKKGFYRYKPREAKAEADARMERSNDKK